MNMINKEDAIQIIEEIRNNLLEELHDTEFSMSTKDSNIQVPIENFRELLDRIIKSLEVVITYIDDCDEADDVYRDEIDELQYELEQRENELDNLRDEIKKLNES